MRLLLEENVRDNLKQHYKEVHGKEKLVKDKKTLTFSMNKEEPPKKKGKSDNR